MRAILSHPGHAPECGRCLASRPCTGAWQMSRRPAMHRSAADVSHHALCAVLLLICLSPSDGRPELASPPDAGMLRQYGPIGPALKACPIPSCGFDADHAKLARSARDASHSAALRCITFCVLLSIRPPINCKKIYYSLLLFKPRPGGRKSSEQ